MRAERSELPARGPDGQERVEYELYFVTVDEVHYCQRRCAFCTWHVKRRLRAFDHGAYRWHWWVEVEVCEGHVDAALKAIAELPA